MSETLLNKLLEAQNEIKDGFVVTPATTLEKYYEKVGRVQGIQVAIDLMLQLMRDTDQDDN